LFPVSRRDHARDLLAVCGREALLDRARALKNSSELKRALAMAELATDADPGDEEAVRLNAEILEAIALTERSFIARNLFTGARQKLLQRQTKQNAP
jgi:alkyl sulfatase BDS1-like metallo-beta-lactamase superfamily hydrolase